MSVLRTLVLLLVSAFVATGQTGRIELLTASPDHKRSEGARSLAGAPEISRDGKFVLYLSAAPNILSNAPLATALNLYLVNCQTSETTLVSVGLNGESANESVTAYEFSANGRRILFESSASNLVPDDTNNQSDIFVRDLDLNKTILVNAGPNGEVLSSGASGSSFSADGNIVSFLSAYPYDAGDTNGTVDAFVRDLSTDFTQLISNPTYSIPTLRDPVMSEDGRFVALTSFLTSPYLAEVLELHDRALGTTTRLVEGRNGAVPNVLLSRNGQSLFYITNRTLLRFKTDTGETETISTNAVYPTVFAASADGRTLIYGQYFGATNAFNIWREGRSVTSFPRMIDERGVTFNGETYTQLALSADGKYALFPCSAYGPPGPLADDRVYVCDLENLTATLVPTTARTIPFYYPSDATMSDDGSIVAFIAPLPGIYEGDKPILNVFAWDRLSNTTNLISQSVPSDFENTESGSSKFIDTAPISEDGSKIVYTSTALARGVADTNGATDVFVLDRTTGQRELVSVSQDGSSTGNRGSWNPIISPNGRMVAFVSESTNIVAGARRRPQLYVRDLQTRVTKLVGPVPFFRLVASFNADGSRLAFLSNVPTYYDSRVLSQNTQVYVYDADSGTVSLVTYDYTETREASQDTTTIAISSDGRKVAFRSLAVNLTQGSFSPGVFIRDIETGNLTRMPGPAFNATTLSPTVQFNRDGSALFYGGGGTNFYSASVSGGSATVLATNVVEANISGDGKWMVFTRRVSIGLPRRNLFLSDTTSGTELLISSNTPTGAGPAVPFADAGVKPQISQDGRFVAFQTRANLAANDTNTQTDVYLYDRDANQVSVLSVNEDGQAAGASSRPIVTSNYVAFCSFAPDIVRHDYNNGADIFLAPLPATDSDKDGIDDEWELANFNSLDSDSTVDTDSDGMSNAAEFAAGTNPTDPQSRLFLKAVMTNENGELLLKWASVAGRAYKVQARARLTDGQWEDLTDAVIAGSAEATISLSLTTPPSELYLRVVVAE